MRRRTVSELIVAALVVGMVLAAALTGCQGQSPSPEPTETNTPVSAEFSVSMEGPIMFGEWVSLAEAERRVPFRILQPAYLPEGVTLARVMTGKPDKRPKERQAVALVYSDGLTIIQNPEPNPPQAKFFEQVKNTPPFVVLEVNGSRVIGHEPVDTTALGGTVHNPGAVMWWTDGKRYQVIADMPLEELLRIAESLR